MGRSRHRQRGKTKPNHYQFTKGKWCAESRELSAKRKFPTGEKEKSQEKNPSFLKQLGCSFTRSFHMQPAIKTTGGYDGQVIYEDDTVSIFRIIWHPGSRTPKHDHGDSIGSVLIIRGRIFEIQDGKKFYLKKGKIAHITS